MTKRELIELLEFVDDEEEIYIAIPTQNYWRMIAVKSLNSVDCKPVKYSDYLESLTLLSDEENNPDDNEVECVWVLEA
jgi:hypothetical protein